MVTTAPRRCAGGAHAAGMTLTELLVVMAIVAILLALGAPAFIKTLAEQRSKAMGSDLVSMLTRARSEAIRLNKNVTVQPVTSGMWEAGWSILDPNGGAALEVHDAFTKGSATGPNDLIYLPNGRLQDTGSTFTITNPDTTTIRCVGVDLSGRPYQKNTAC